MSELPSRTSIWAAAARAVGSRPISSQWRCPDALADKLMGPRELELIGDHPLAKALQEATPEAERNLEVLSASMTLVVRTRFIDDALLRLLSEGVTQVVIMGAGWDTRAYRFQPQLRGTRVFEVDRPSTQNWKRRRAEEALGPPPENLTYLQIDFRTQTLEDVLNAAGYDPAQKTFFIWEGVTMYLPDAAVRDTLRWISRQAPGGTVVFDFAYRSLIDFINQARANQLPPSAEPLSEAAKIGIERLRQIARWGEPWIFGVPDDASAEFVEGLGLKHRETIAMASTEAAKRYLGWTEDKPLPAAIRQLYAIAEASVR